MARKEGNSTSASVPKAVVSRMSLYLRELQQIMRGGQETISSTQLGKVLGITDAQVRKDFAYFGQFGYPGIGYRCDELVGEIRRILGTDRMWPVALVGCGHMGQALLGYRGFAQQGFSVIVGFDVDTGLVGQEIAGIPVHHLDETHSVLQANEIRLAILAVPAASAQQVAEQLIGAGITGILNFAPIMLNLPRSISVVDVDLATQLEQLSFAVLKDERKK